MQRKRWKRKRNGSYFDFKLIFYVIWKIVELEIMSEKESLKGALPSDFVYPSKKRIFLLYVFYHICLYFSYTVLIHIYILFIFIFIFVYLFVLLLVANFFRNRFPCSFILFCFDLFLHPPLPSTRGSYS